MDAVESIVPVLVSLYHPFERTLSLALPASTPLSTLSSHLAPYCPPAQQALSYANGRPLPRLTAPAFPLSSLDGADKAHGGFIALRLAVRLPGGKGGFASQLRAQGGRMSSNKAQNTDSCRGLDGRRLSTIKEAQKLAALLEAEPDRLAAEAQAKQKRLDDLNAEIKRLERQAGVEAGSGPSASADGASGSGTRSEGGPSGAAAAAVKGGAGGQKRRLEDSKYVEESREIVSGVKDAVRAAMLKKRKKNKATAATTADSTTTTTEVKATGSSGSEGEKENAAAAAGKGKGKGKAVDQDADADADEAQAQEA
ncbi:hypothetical protein RHOSPDRAFT_28871 [Rhodotorula sp. JG-1b]|nr:hypothetical protein RHOSPDRAFT_28871 [Rhodotorula sp. JG-1b]